MPITKFFRVAVEGATCDGRTLERKHIEQMAKRYNPTVYGARINLEHISGGSPESVFRAYGDVLETKTEEITDGDLKGKLALLVKADATDELVELKKKRQKVYHSIEVHPSFADTGEAYLMGLACTDNPASLGGEFMKFCAGSETNPLASRKHDPACFFTETIESSLEFEQEAPAPEAGKKFLSRITEMITGNKQKFSQETDDLRGAVTLLAESQRDALDQLEKFGALEKQHRELQQNFTTLQSDFDTLKGQLDAQPNNYTQRPPATGGEGKSTAELADC
ncbi:GPO family capsid scaffolding protein [Serratia marcescens]|uniref:GPO family capsid scaffolding protein n=1 Tax=Serratia marcescens TaxID=615 RepID=UPI001F15457C|nr:GPO family capsid scaffolding protein [Serratia marcescens]